MAYEITITDSVDTLELPLLEVPLKESKIKGETEVITMDLNVYTDFFAQKKAWSHTWANLTEAEYDALEEFFDRQYELYEYPVISIPDLGVVDVVVKMDLSDRDIIDNCGTVENVTVTFRETIQMSQGSSSS